MAAKTTISLPVELLEAVRASGMNVSAVCQEALRRELVAQGGYDMEILLSQSVSNIEAALHILREQT